MDAAPPESTQERRDVGLCFDCRNARIVRGRRSRFWYCELSRIDDRFVKYPRLPVVECAGYESSTG